MPTILCFGDSNTFGYIPGGAGRYGEETRWPCLLGRLPGYRVVENGVLGRTTVFEDPDRPGRKGLDDVAEAMRRAEADILVLMLGTNDCKTQFEASPLQIANGMVSLARKARQVRPDVRILLVSPPLLGATALFCGDYDQGSLSVSARLPAAYRNAAEENDCAFWDAAVSSTVSPVDGEHLSVEGHRTLARDLHKIIARLISTEQ